MYSLSFRIDKSGVAAEFPATGQNSPHRAILAAYLLTVMEHSKLSANVGRKIQEATPKKDIFGFHRSCLDVAPDLHEATERH